jgi:hypothetical protein
MKVQKNKRQKEISRTGCFSCLFFPFAFRIVKQRKPSNPPAGRTPEPFRLKAKKASQSVKGQKTFLLKKALSQQQKTFCAKSALDPLPMRVFRSTCKRGKIIPPLGNLLASSVKK